MSGPAAHPYAYVPQNTRPYQQPGYEMYYPYPPPGQHHHHHHHHSPSSDTTGRNSVYEDQTHWSSAHHHSAASSSSRHRTAPYPPPDYSRSYADPPPVSDHSRVRTSGHAPVQSPSNAATATTTSSSSSWSRAAADYETPQSPALSERSKSTTTAATTTNTGDNKCQADRPYACDMCKLTFNRQHDLKRHRDTHTGAKPFQCHGTGCGKSFTRKDALKRHQLVKRCGLDPDDPALLPVLEPTTI